MPAIEIATVRNDTVPPSWTVEAINTDGDGGVETATFAGPDAEKRAADYAAARIRTWSSPYRVLP